MTIRITLEPELEAQVQRLAAMRHSTAEAVVLEAVRDAVIAKPIPSWVGIVSSGEPDLGSRAEELLFQDLED
jgi:hypothetical protein